MPSQEFLNAVIDYVGRGYGYVKHCGVNRFVGPDRERRCPTCGQVVTGTPVGVDKAIRREQSK